MLRSSVQLLYLALPVAAAGLAAVTVPEVRAPTNEAITASASAASFSGGTNRKHEFYFTRAIYSSGFGRGRGGFGSWATDYPKADVQFLAVLKRLARELDAASVENAIRLDDPNLRRFPFVYAVEVGQMMLSDPEIKGLREYLLAGGFLIVDDFWGTNEWAQFEYNIRRTLPEHSIIDLDLTHPIFHSYYDIKEILQPPYHGNACGGYPYYENGGIVPVIRGIFDEKGRLMVLISHNADLGDAWEWMELACYPLTHSTYAAQLAVNTIVYTMSH